MALVAGLEDLHAGDAEMIAVQVIVDERQRLTVRSSGRVPPAWHGHVRRWIDSAEVSRFMQHR